MLRLIPRPLHVIALRSAHAIRIRWWRLSGARLSGCRVLVLDAAERVLLIRHSYGNPHWMLPGGGIKRGEDPLATAAREVLEETSVRIDHAVEIDLVTEQVHGTPNEVRVIAGWTEEAPRPDGREIVEAAFFALDALPGNVSARLLPLLPGYVTAARAARPVPAD